MPIGMEPWRFAHSTATTGMRRGEILQYVPLAVLMAPAIHVIFSLFVGWHDYMPFPFYVPSVFELVAEPVRRFGNTGIAEEHGVVSQTLVCATSREKSLATTNAVSYRIS